MIGSGKNVGCDFIIRKRMKVQMRTTDFEGHWLKLAYYGGPIEVSFTSFVSLGYRDWQNDWTKLIQNCCGQLRCKTD